MYIPFIIYLTVFAIITGAILSKKFRELLAVVLVAAIIFGSVLALHGVARAEEERTCFVTNFMLNLGCVEVTDEDGFCWLFDLGKNSWEIGQEFTLKLLVVPELWNDVEQVA